MYIYITGLQYKMQPNPVNQIVLLLRFEDTKNVTL